LKQRLRFLLIMVLRGAQAGRSGNSGGT